MKWVAYFAFSFTADNRLAAEEYADLLRAALDWPSHDERFDERFVDSLWLDRLDKAED
jgi:hypothetical protein